MRTVAIASMLLAALGATSCVDLPTVESGSCGNKIVDANEDCDGDATAPKGTTCRSPGSVGACRFDCSTGSQCPPGYACGSDAICREHSGTFTDVGTSVPVSPTQLLVDDFDGDGRSDVLAYSFYAGEARALFFEPSGALAQSVSMASDHMIPTTGKLATAAGAAAAPSTFTFATRQGLGVMRGQKDRTFAPTPYSTLPLPWPDGHVITLDAMPPTPSKTMDQNDPASYARWLGDEAVIFHGAYAYVTEDANLQPDNPNQTSFRLPRDAEPVGPIPVGDLDVDPVDSPCQEMAITYGDDKVYIVTPCVWDGSVVKWNRSGPGGAPVKNYPIVTLFDKDKNPVKGKIASIFLTHLNAPPAGQPAGMGQDDFLDLVINTYDEGTSESRVFAALGLGNGQFFGLTDALESVPDGAVELTGLAGGKAKLLAVGDVNLDGKIDFVYPNGILMSAPDGTWGVAGEPLRAKAWTDAAIADFNGDGRPDVICGSSGDVGIDFFTNAGGGLLNPLAIPTEDGVSGFVVGDFDGDLTNDVAFRLVSFMRNGGGAGQMGADPTSSDVPDSLGVIFGRFGQPPEAPRNLGQLARIASIVTGRTLVTEFPADAISDLGVVSTSLTANPVGSVAVFQGRADRLLESPFGLNIPGTDPFSNKTIIGTTIGQFDNSDNASHLDIVALVHEEGFKTSTDGPMTTAGTDQYVFWLLPSTGTASLDITTAKPLVLDPANFPNIDLSTAQMATIDIDGDGQDEIALVAKYTDPTTQDEVVAVAVARRGDDGTPTLAGPFPLSDELYYTSIVVSAGGAPTDKPGGPDLPGVGRPQLCVADIDGDGKKDLVTLAADDSYSPRIVVLWNTGNKEAPFADDRGHVAITDDPYITAYTCANLDSDLASELVVLSSAGAYSVDFKGRIPGKPKELEGVSSGSVVASGDFDGDGIADIVVATSADTRLYRGKPVIQ